MPQARQDEAPEYPFAGPFGGLQSEVSPSQIGNTGFADVQNIIFRNSSARLVPEFKPLIAASPNSAEHIMGIWDFFDKGGGRHSGVFTRTGMYEFNRNIWSNVPPGATLNDYEVGQPLQGLGNQFFQTAIVGYKMFFCQGSNNIQFYDGGVTQSQSPTPGVPGPNSYFTADTYGTVIAPPGLIYTHFFPPVAQYLMELDFHLVVGYGSQASEAVQEPMEANFVAWSAAGDGTNWYTYDAGSENLYNNLGRITGMTRLFQTGYIFQQQGVTQVVPTGVALSPFQFITMGAYAKGNTFRYSLASFGEMVACYVGRDDVYVFDGTSSQPIGQHPIDGNRRLGARTKIMQDLWAAQAYYVQSSGTDNTRVWSVITTAANGVTHEAYWLFIPELNKCWVYNFDESNWAQLFFQSGRLQGPAASQFWAEPSDFPLPMTGYKDSLVIADNLNNNLDYLDFSTPGSVPTTGSIYSSDGWYIKSGELDFDDNRHEHTVNKIRMVLDDVANPMTFFIRLSNEVNYVTPLQQITVGTGSYRSITLMIDLGNGITGKYISWELSGPQGVNFQLVEITPYPIMAGEVSTPGKVLIVG
jgi:hypothetical protein